ncbi:hypothetical protein [Streptosporangium sp. KLBMP 9127]|nr:hypothetical protein [Streptosporangium sp. KLBMP 9127]
MSSRTRALLTQNLDLLDLSVPEVLDDDPPAAMLAAPAERTGVDHARPPADRAPEASPSD